MSETYLSLAQLNAMTREDFIRGFPQKNARWRDRGYLIDAKALMKNLILATRDLQWRLSDERGCREVWYNPVKPILLRAIGMRANKYMLPFEGLLSKMVKEGILTYADLGILDFRTMREIYENVERAQCWKNILLFVEKDGAYVHLKPLQGLFNVNLISGAGWSNTSGIERMLRDLARKGITKVVVFTVTDYDPFGFAIDREFVDKCETLGLYVNEHHRIGINPEHATPELLDVQKYPVKRGRRLSVNGIRFDSDQWLAEYGIEDQYGLEIEAISGQPDGHRQLRIIVAKELLKYLQETDRIEEITKEAWKNVPFKALETYLGIPDWIERENFLELPVELPSDSEYLTYSEYKERFDSTYDAREDATRDIKAEINDLQEQIDDLESEKKEMEKPYDNELDYLRIKYQRSQEVLAYCLYHYYLSNKEKWPRHKYTLGYPAGCLVEATEKNIDLNHFIRQVDTKEPISDIQIAIGHAIANGDIKRLISKVMNGASLD